MAPTIGLVACSAGKLPAGAPAQHLYTGALFGKARTYVQRECDTWLILSALHGVLGPAEWVEPYSMYLPAQPAAYRAQWRRRVAEQLDDLLRPGTRVVCLASAPYRTWIDDLPQLRVEAPLTGLGIGQQLGWLTRANSERAAAPFLTDQRG